MTRRGRTFATALGLAGVSLALASEPQGDPVLGLLGPPLAIAAFDADGDARPDLVVSLDGTPSRLVLLRNAGHGGFEPPAALPDVAAGSLGAVRALAAVDVDRDGRVDVVGVGRPSALWRNQGDGAFAAEALPPAADGSHVVAARFEPGGAPDLVVVTDDGGPAVVVLRNDGTGRFSALPSVAAPEAWPVRQVVVADVDHDGAPDVAVLAGPGGRVLLLRGLGGGALAAPTRLDVPELCLALATLDGALVAFGQHAARIFPASGARDLAFDGADLAAACAATGAEAGHARRVATTDEGELVEIVATPDRVQRRTAWRAGRRLRAAPVGPVQRLALGDFDGDRRPDLAALTWRSRAGVALLIDRKGEAAAPADAVLALSRGRVSYRARARQAEVQLAGTVPDEVAAAAMRGGALRVEVASGGASFAAELALARGGVLRSLPGSAARVRGVLDPAQRRFVIAAELRGLGDAPANPVVVRLTAQGASARHEATWRVSRPGELRWGLPETGPATPRASVPAATPPSAELSPPPTPLEVTTVLRDGREVPALVERSSGRTWTFDVAANQWVPQDAARQTAPRTEVAPEGHGPRPVYHLVAKHSGLFLGIREGRQDEGADAIQWTYCPGDEVRFELLPAAGGRVRVRAVHSGKWLTVAGNGTHNAARIAQTGDASAPSTQWELVPSDGGFYRFVSAHSGQSLAISAKEMGRGSLAIQWPSYPGDEQLWRLVPAPR